ncbi:hypothetical protein Tco_0157587 [Tanacetum coccineum]
MGDIDINTLSIEQNMALTQRDRLGVVIPELRNDFEFEIKSQFMSELRYKLFAGTDDEHVHEHVRRVLEIMDLFHIPGVTRDAVMLRVFPMTLSGRLQDFQKGASNQRASSQRRWQCRIAGEHVKYIGFLEETLNKFMEESIKKQSLLDGRIRKCRADTDMSLRMLEDATKNLQGKSEQLT